MYRLILLILFLFPITNAYSSNENRLISLVETGNHSKIIDFLSNPSNNAYINSFDVNGITSPLIEAVLNNNYHIVQILLNYSANPNIQNIGGASPLHIAARRGYDNIISLLIQHKANVNLQDHEGCTPLMRAVANKRDIIVDNLIKEGKANINIRNNKGERVIAYAIKSGSKSMVQKTFFCDFEMLKDGQYIAQLIQNRESSFIKEITPIVINCPTLAAYILPSTN